MVIVCARYRLAPRLHFTLTVALETLSKSLGAVDVALKTANKTTSDLRRELKKFVSMS